MEINVENNSKKVSEEVSKQRFVKPHYEVTSNEHSHVLHVFMPGVKKNSATITLENGKLSIEGHSTKHTGEGWRQLHHEIRDVDYRLQLDLNLDIDEEKIVASAQNGILSVTLPVAEKAKPKVIAIS